MKAVVDQDVCTGCGLCEETCPEVFSADGDTATVLVEVVPKEAEGSCIDAMNECPVDAISVED
ncbi:MAG: ferredoxin [Candidatus Hydrogenedentes bacterium]|nr:ferredoxin [Candidatus Hydrogenedentota bacterium]